MKPIMQFLVLTLCLPLLTACGSDSDKPGAPDRATLPSPEIAGFSVTGTSPTQHGVIPINAGVEDGRFTIDWNIATANAFHLQLFLSHDESISADDLRIFDNSLCGALHVNDCLAQDQYICHFGTDNMLKCTDGWEKFDNNLNTLGFLTGLPQASHVIGKACVINDCKTAAIKVEFQ